MNPWLLVGWLCVALGAIGAVLPLLPTTPFILLAAWCFARSSKRWHDWLYASRVFGPLLRDWDSGRCMPLRAKVVALVMMTGVGGTSMLLAVPPGWPRWAGLALLGVGTVSVLMIRTCPPRAPPASGCAACAGQAGRQSLEARRAADAAEAAGAANPASTTGAANVQDAPGGRRARR